MPIENKITQIDISKIQKQKSSNSSYSNNFAGMQSSIFYSLPENNKQTFNESLGLNLGKGPVTRKNSPNFSVKKSLVIFKKVS